MMDNVITLGRVEEIESDANPAVAQALTLMKEALRILDAGDAGYSTLACHLSLAIDRGEGRRAPQSVEECEATLDEILASAPAPASKSA